MKVREGLWGVVSRFLTRIRCGLDLWLTPQPAAVPIRSFEPLENRVLLSQSVWFDIDTGNATPNNDAAGAQSLYVAVADGGNVAIDLNYTATNDAGDPDNSLPALNFRLHFDSSQLTIDPATGVSNVILSSALSELEVVDDTEDLDGDASTDKYLQFFWFEFDNTGIIPFPNTDVPTRLATIEFAAAGDYTGSTLRFTGDDPITEIEDDGDTTPEDEEFPLSANAIFIDDTDVTFDFDGDNSIDFADYGPFTQAFLATTGDPNYDVRLDYNFDGSIDFADYGPFTQAFLKSLDDPTLRYPEPMPALLSLEGQAVTEGQALDAADTAEVDAILAEAIAIWDAALPDIGVAEQLASVTVNLLDLPGEMLATAANGVITLDIDAAGHGWFVDATPADNVEFDMIAEGQWSAGTLSDAAERVDLLTVLVHELGHELGLDHTEEGVMSSTLAISTRLLPTSEEAAHWLEEMLAKDAELSLIEI